MIHGLRMDSPLTVILSEIYIDDLEDTFFNDENRLFNKYISYWQRYCDYSFVIWTGSNALQHGLHYLFNNLSLSNLAFTIELGTDKTDNFQNLSIKYFIYRMLKYDIYRKPITTDCIITYNYTIPRPQKHLAFIFIFNRLLETHLSKPNFQK